ncbi:MAG: DUF4157 domain-containing protein [Acidobacteriia bacterium]|nr:DUF4157 domain-containing protein [Terriglobia bacterium]
MSHRSLTAVATPAKPALQPVCSGVLQRKCDCGQHTIHGEECDECKNKGTSLQRRGTSTGPSEVPTIVHEVLRSPGQPLDGATRAFMEPSFGHDFSHVRVHTDFHAGQSARAVNASAYTVGRDIVFDPRFYAPNTRQGRGLLAHELTHVLQQGDGAQSASQLLRMDTHNVLENEADRFAESILAGEVQKSDRATNTGYGLQRKNGGETIEVDLVPTSPEEQERLKKLGIQLPTVSPETWRDIGGVSDNAGAKLSDKEKNRIAQITKTGVPSAAMAFRQGLQFVLHDTAAKVGSARLQELKKQGRGPLGEGAAAYIPAVGDAVTARSFFEAKRPTGTEFERGQDIMKKADREKAYRSVWGASKASEHQPALDRALDGLGLTPKEVTQEQSAAKKQLEAGSGDVRTTASWAVAEICAKVDSAGIQALAASPTSEAQLEGSCKKLAPLLAQRAARIGSMVNVEIVQERGSDCRTTGKLQPLPKPAYSDDQFNALTKTYLRAALQAGQFPEITTHFWVDRTAGDHCDPRCFDLTHLYDSIAATLGHGKGSTYGIKPNYGTKQGTNNLWWLDPVCGGSPPKG